MKKNFAIFIFFVLVLLGFNKLFSQSYFYNTSLDTNSLMNKRHVNSQALFDKTWLIIKKNFYDSNLNGQDWDRWKEHYKGKIKTDEDVDVAINTMLESLNDPYSIYLDKRAYAEQTSSINSKIFGIGVNISSIGGKTYVVNVIEDTPAFKAKMKSGDIIYKVNGKDVSGLKTSEVADLVRGPDGTSVNLTVIRDKKTLQKTIKRSEIKIKTVKSSIDKEKNIGYIQILSFIGTTTPDEFVAALEKTKNTKGLIIDLRGNSGGLLPNAILIANMFINKGNLVSIVGRRGYKEDIYAQRINFVVEKPLLVLIDGGSASASEILSGALKDYHKAKLIGTKTFGKGMVQKIIPMPNETGLNLTIAKYLTPAGHDINKKGITPDIEVKLTEKDVQQRNDVQLKQAKAVMTGMMSEK